MHEYSEIISIWSGIELELNKSGPLTFLFSNHIMAELLFVETIPDFVPDRAVNAISSNSYIASPLTAILAMNDNSSRNVFDAHHSFVQEYLGLILREMIIENRQHLMPIQEREWVTISLDH